MFLFLHPYLRGSVTFAHRALALGCVAAFLGIVWLDLGTGLNIPALVWHDEKILQFAAGFSIAALFAYVWLVTYILDARYHPECIEAAVKRTRRSMAFKFLSLLLPPAETKALPNELDEQLRRGGDGLRWYLGATFVPCAILLMLPAFFSIDGTAPYIHFVDRHSNPPDQLYIAQHWPFALGVLLTFVGMRLIADIGNVFRRRLLASEQRLQFAHVYWLQLIAGVLFVVLLVLYGLTSIAVNRNWWQPPPVAAVCMLAGLLVGVSGAAWFHLRLGAVPLLIGIIAWMLYCNSPDYKLRFPHMEHEYARITDLDDHEEPALNLDEVYAGEAEPQQAAKDEAERVARMIASLQVQRDPKSTVESKYQALADRKLTDPANYARLVRHYDVELQLMGRDEFNAIKTWRDQFKGKSIDNRPKLVIVTATGGANRSGLWTTKVLYELHNDPALKDFPKHVRIISGASGGMVGAAYYVGSVQEDGSLQPGFQPLDIAQDFLTPIINSAVFRELPQLTLPREHYDGDRGEMLDRAMEGEVPNIDPDVRQRLNNVFSRSFADWADSEKAGWRPSMIFTPMIVEDGRRLFISNRHVPFLTVSKGDFLLPNRPNFGQEQPETGRNITTMQTQVTQKRRRKQGEGSEDVYSRPGVEFFRLFPEARNRFHVSTAARMNATFPFVSPAVSLPTRAPRRVVDAGYFDNTGVSVAAAWIFENREWISTKCSGVVVIQIRDFSSHQENRNLSFPLHQGGSFLPGLTGVLSAVDHARSASANYRNDDDLQQLAKYFKKYFEKYPEDLPGKCPAAHFFTTVVFERYTDVGMNWYLSKSDKKDIIDSWDQGKENMNPASLQKLREWWKNH
jgi:hypothetical protein